jgi:hypothetical protein
MNKSKAIGTRGETAVARVLQDYFPHCERRPLHGSNDHGDLLITAGLIAEVKWGNHAKKASLKDVDKWWRETQREVRNAGAEMGLLIIQRNGIGVDRASLSRCFFDAGQMFKTDHAIVEAPLITVAKLLRQHGWGE